jgi:osmotically-inducible protein OsmY
MTNRELRARVLEALDWEPSVDSSDLDVSVADEGVVTLRGRVRSQPQKVAAERVTLGVYGVRGVANDLVVVLTPLYERTDTDIAQAAVEALRWNSLVPPNRIAVAVSNGRVTVTGTVDWQYQKNAADRAVRSLTGVRDVSNEIVITPEMKATDVQAKIEDAFRRSAEIDARRINVETHDGHVTLTGHVHSWLERQEAMRAAWAAPGVTHVADHLVVVP